MDRYESSYAPDSTVRFSAILISALICMAIQFSLVLLGGGLGLTILDNAGDTLTSGMKIGGFVFGALAVLISFFVGGYLASRLSPARSRAVAAVHGAGVWAVVLIVMVSVVGTTAFSFMDSTLKQAGLAVGAANTAEALIEELRERQPRIVSDVQLKEGKVVSELQLGKPASSDRMARGVMEESKQNIQKAGKQAKKQTKDRAAREAVDDIQDASATASLAAFGVVLLSAIAASLGGVAAWRRTGHRGRLL